MVVTSIALRVLALALPMLTAMVVDRVVPRGDYDLLFVVGTGIGAVLAFQLLASLIRAHLLIELRTRLDTRMTFGFLAHLLSLPYAYFNRRSAGDLLLRVSSNTQIRDLLTSIAALDAARRRARDRLPGAAVRCCRRRSRW